MPFESPLSHSRDQSTHTHAHAPFQATDKLVMPIRDLHQSVADDLKALRRSLVISPDTKLYGFIYRVEDGGLALVASDEGRSVMGWSGERE
jgi:hypothetical protein